MRTVDATLVSALSEGKGLPILRGYLGHKDGTIHTQANVTAYKLTGQTLEMELDYPAIQGDQDAVWLERGLLLNGTEYTVTTGRFNIATQKRLPNGRQQIKATLFPKAHYVDLAADGTYRDVLSALCTTYGKTAVFEDDAAAWLGYEFFPLGKALILNDPNYIAHLLQQKWLLFFCDHGNEEVYFYGTERSMFGDPDIGVTPLDDYFVVNTAVNARYFMWHDELGATHTYGADTNPMHNLGYLHSTADHPYRTSVLNTFEVISRPDLRLMDGDKFGVTVAGIAYKGFALVTEQYDPHASKPHNRWRMIVESNPVFTNTEGGAMPSTIERISNYTPLNTSMFAGVLDQSCNNLQAAMDKIDDHTHPANGAGAAGFMPYALPIGAYLGANNGMSNALAANGGTMLIPILLEASIQLASVSVRDADTTGARKWGWDIYKQETTDSTSLTRVAQCSEDETFTASAASWRTIAANGGPIDLDPGLYWLAVQNRHATSTFAIGTSTGYWNNANVTKTTSNPNGDTLDVSAGWSKNTGLAFGRLNGAVFGIDTLF